MRIADAHAVINYLKIQTDKLAAEIEEPIPLDPNGNSDLEMTKKIAKISCELASHKLAVEMLEEYCEALSENLPASSTQAKEPEQPQKSSKESREPSSVRFEEVRTKERSLSKIPEDVVIQEIEEDVLFDPWAGKDD